MEATFLSTTREALLVVVLASLPPLVAALVVGLLVALGQALTQVQEQTLGVLARILAVFGALYFVGYWMASLVTRFGQKVFTEFPGWVR
jgi:type III secretion HrpO family protein